MAQYACHAKKHVACLNAHAGAHIVKSIRYSHAWLKIYSRLRCNNFSECAPGKLPHTYVVMYKVYNEIDLYFRGSRVQSSAPQHKKKRMGKKI